MKLKKIKLYRPILLDSNNRESISDDICQLSLFKDLVWLKDRTGVVRIIPLTNVECMIPHGDAPKGAFDDDKV